MKKKIWHYAWKQVNTTQLMLHRGSAVNKTQNNEVNKKIPLITNELHEAS